MFVEQRKVREVNHTIQDTRQQVYTHTGYPLSYQCVCVADGECSGVTSRSPHSAQYSVNDRGPGTVCAWLAECNRNVIDFAE